MYVVALTGGIGSGKSLVSHLFSQLGIEIIDTDVIARDLVKPGSLALTQINNHFGESILNDKQELNRSMLRKIIFSQHTEKKWLENILHPLINAEIFRKIKTANSPYCIVVIPLLFETHAQKEAYIDRVLVVETSCDTQIQRIIQRDRSTKEDVEKIIQMQVSAATRRGGADDIIKNNASESEVKAQVVQLHALYLKFAKQKV